MKKFLDKYGLSQTALKIIAVLSMLIDHSTAVLLDYHHPAYYTLRGVGRLAFPIFCFLIVEGYFHTKSVKKYAMRLFAFALISEVPFDLAFKQKFFYIWNNNVFFTLLIGLLCIWAADVLIEKNKYYIPLAVLAVAAGAFLANYLRTDYGWYGVTLIAVFYSFHAFKPLTIVPFSLLTFYHTDFFNGKFHIQNWCLLSYIPILLYNGKKGKLKLKYFFYIFYPAHLIILYILNTVLQVKIK